VGANGIIGQLQSGSQIIDGAVFIPEQSEDSPTRRS
jgi:hypothetical protein